MDPELRDIPVGSGNDAAPWRNAFMLNRIPDFTGGTPAEEAYADCWKKVHELLETGINSETCVRYSFTGGYTFPVGAGEFVLNFVDCDTDFQQGDN